MMALSAAAQTLRGRLHGPDGEYSSVSIDTRRMDRGALFFAITGGQGDGHDHVPQAQRAGAAGAVVSTVQACSLPQISVDDTTLALGRLGSDWRARFPVPVAAITGSNGKTTVTALAGSILNRLGNCLVPEKSFNNHWGLPLTLLRLDDACRFAVLEMGTSGHGEIGYLSSLAKPTIVLINNISMAHAEGLGGLEQICLAKSEIFQGLREGGTAVLNADDPHFERLCGYLAETGKDVETLTFGTAPGADIRCTGIRPGEASCSFALSVAGQTRPVALPLPGAHNALNATAAAALAHAAGAGLEDIRSGLESVRGVPGRLQYRTGINRAVVVDDSYNANPRSVMAAIDVLAAHPGRKILVLGEMAELGPGGPAAHREVGAYARGRSIDRLRCFSDPSSELSRAYRSGYGQEARIIGDLAELVADLRVQMDSGTMVLVKGSRSSRMERVVEGIIAGAYRAPGREVDGC